MKLFLKYIISLIVLTFVFVTNQLVNVFGVKADDFNAIDAIGSFTGGVLGTFFVIIGTIIAFTTYKNQRKSQEKQQIESRFFELLRLHQENVTTLKNIDSDIFNLYIKLILTFQEAITKYKTDENKEWEPEDILKLSYLYFFYGWKELSTDRLNGIQIDSSDIKELNMYFEKLHYKYNPTYKDFGIYFRQLYQTVKYIDNKKILSYKEKYEYIKTLRARINVEEQYLLFLNSLVGSGLHWENETLKRNDRLITKYNLIKNIPKGFKQIQGIDFRTQYEDIFFEGGSDIELKKRKKIEKKYF